MAFSKSSMVPRRIELLASMTYGHPEVEPKTALPRPKVKSGTAPRLFRVNSLGTVSNAESTISSEIKTRVPSTLAPCEENTSRAPGSSNETPVWDNTRRVPSCIRVRSFLVRFTVHLLHFPTQQQRQQNPSGVQSMRLIVLQEGVEHSSRPLCRIFRQRRYFMLLQQFQSFASGSLAQVHASFLFPLVLTLTVEDRGSPLTAPHVLVGVFAGHEMATRTYVRDCVHSKSLLTYLNTLHYLAVKINKLIGYYHAFYRCGQTEVQIAHIVVKVGAGEHREKGNLTHLHAGLGIQHLGSTGAAVAPIRKIQPLGHLHRTHVCEQIHRRIVHSLSCHHVKYRRADTKNEGRSRKVQLMDYQAKERFRHALRSVTCHRDWGRSPREWRRGV